MSAADWPEDANQENGNYLNRCTCGRIFTGNKHRITCHICADEWQAKWNAMTDAEKATYMEQQRAAVAEWVETHIAAR